MGSFDCVRQFAIGFVVLLAFLNLTMSFHIDISPTKYDATSCGGVAIGCTLGGSDKCADNAVMTLVLHKEEEYKTLAFVRQPSSIKYVDASKKYHVQGQLDQNYNGFLNVTFPNPENGDSGVYSCVIYCYHDDSTAVEDHISRTLAVDIYDYKQELESLKTLVASLMEEKTEGQAVSDRVDQLTSTTQALVNTTQRQGNEISRLDDARRAESERLDQLTSTTQRQVNDIADLDVRTTRLANTTEMQSALIADLGVKVSFTAGLSSSPTVPGGKDVVFDKVIMRQGDGYDPITGIFTVPVSGTYSFVLVMMAYPSSSDRTGQVDILVNGQSVASLLVWVPTSVDLLQSSTSTVAWLTVGQQVKARGDDEMRWLSYPYSVFTGFLVSPE